MEGFCVVEMGEGIRAAVRTVLAERGSGPIFGRSGAEPALLVVSPGAIRRRRSLPERCGVLLVPGDGGDAVRTVRAGCAVSYGGSCRDSLTISSREKTRIVAAIQRGLVTVQGEAVECQEFTLVLAPGRDERTVLAVAGTLILLGVPPEETAYWRERARGAAR